MVASNAPSPAPRSTENGRHLIGQIVYFKADPQGWSDNLFLNPYHASSDTASFSASPEEQVGGNLWAKWEIVDAGDPYIMLESVEKPDGKVFYLCATTEDFGGGYKVKAIDSIDPHSNDMLHWTIDKEMEEDQYRFTSKGVSNHCLRLGSGIDGNQNHCQAHIWQYDYETAQKFRQFRPHWTSGYQSVCRLQNDSTEAVTMEYIYAVGYSSMEGQSVTVGGAFTQEYSVEIKKFLTLALEVELSGTWSQYSSTTFVDTTKDTITLEVPAGGAVELYQLTGTYDEARVLSSDMQAVDVETGRVVMQKTPSGETVTCDKELHTNFQEGGGSQSYSQSQDANTDSQAQVQAQDQPQLTYTPEQRNARDNLIGQVIYIRSTSQTNCWADCDEDRSEAACTGHHPDTVGGALWSKWEVVDLKDDQGTPYIGLRSLLQEYYYLSIDGDEVAHCKYMYNPKNHWTAQYWIDFVTDSETQFRLRTRSDQKYLSVGDQIGDEPKYSLVKREYDASTLWERFVPENGSGYETVASLDNTSSAVGSMDHQMMVGYQDESGGSIEVGTGISYSMAFEIRKFHMSFGVDFAAEWQNSWAQTFSTSRSWKISIPVPPYQKRRLRQLIGTYDQYGVSSSYYIVDEEDA